MTRLRPNGMVFVSYAHADAARVAPLVTALAARFDVWWDKGIPPGDPWRQTLTDQLSSARCVIVVWTVTSVESEFVWSEVQRAQGRGVLIPVKLDDKR